MNNQSPYLLNPGFPVGPGPNMQPFPPAGNCNCANDIRSLDQRMNRIERQVRRLEEKLARLEGYPVPLNNNMYQNATDYQPGHNMM